MAQSSRDFCYFEKVKLDMPILVGWGISLQVSRSGLMNHEAQSELSATEQEFLGIQSWEMISSCTAYLK